MEKTIMKSCKEKYFVIGTLPVVACIYRLSLHDLGERFGA